MMLGNPTSKTRDKIILRTNIFFTDERENGRKHLADTTAIQPIEGLLGFKNTFNEKLRRNTIYNNYHKMPINQKYVFKCQLLQRR